jgi:hypothetical protein
MMTIDEALSLAEESGFSDTTKAILAAEVRRLRDEVNGLTGSLDRAEAQLKEAREQGPVAWLCGKDVTTHKEYAEWFMRFTQEDCTQLYASPVPAVPDHFRDVTKEWQEVLAGLVAIADAKGKRHGSPNHCHSRPGIWDDDNIRSGLAGKPCAECAMYDRARALLQSVEVKK